MQNITNLRNWPILCLEFLTYSGFDIYGINKETEGLLSDDGQISNIFGFGV